MLKYFVKWESCSAQLASIGAAVIGVLFMTMCTEPFGKRSLLLRHAEISAMLNKEDWTWHQLTS